MIFELERRAWPVWRAEQLRQPGRGNRPFPSRVMDGRPGMDRVILAMKAMGPVRIDAVIAAFDAEPQFRRHPIRQSRRKLERELLLRFAADDSRRELLMLAFPFGLESQVRRPYEAIAGQILLDDRLELELELSRFLARDLADP